LQPLFGSNRAARYRKGCKNKMKIISEIKEVQPKKIIMDYMAFKYYLGAELDNFMDAKGSELTISKRELDRLYFDILERFEPYVREEPPIGPLSEIIKNK
jgi:hypothetical protein